MLIIMCLIVSVPVFAQTITGKVTASDGQPLPGVSILVKGTTSGSTTDASGKYSLSAGKNGTLVFSFIGYKTQEVAIENRSVVDIALAEDATMINEVVITAFGVS